jgi:hypothetical protein
VLSGGARLATIQRAIEAHLASRDVARVIYGTIIGLALVVVMEAHPPTAGQAVAALVGTALAVGLAEFYSEIVGAEARTRHPVQRAQMAAVAADSAAVILGAAFPALFFVVAAIGWIELDTAFAVAKWSGLGLLCTYGFLAARLSGARLGAALLHASAVGVVGGALILLKALLH